MEDLDANPLLATYLERREDLLRYFRARLRSEEAARDLVQDIYLRISGRPAESIGNPAAYLYRLGSNLMLDQIKQNRRAERRDAAWRESHVTDMAGEDISETPAADDALAARQQLDRIVEVVERLPPAVREAFRLHKLNGLTHAETAAAMNISRSSVEKHIMAGSKAIIAKVGR